MKNIYIVVIGALCCLSSCAKQDVFEFPPVDDSGDLQFRAKFERPVKAELNTATGKIEWAADDEIAIVDNSGTKVIYVGTPDVGDASQATFSKKAGEENSLGSGPYTAYYPAGIYSGLPSVTVYYNDQDSDLKSLPMAAQSENTTLVFKNLCSIIKLILPAQTGYNFKSVTLSSPSKYLSGKFLLSSSTATLTSGKHYFTLNRANAKAMSSEQVYYLPIPAGTYDDIQVMVYNNAQGEQSFYLNKSRNFERNTIYSLTLDCSDFRINLSRDRTFDGAGSADDRYLVRKTANCYFAKTANSKYKFLPTKGDAGDIVSGIRSAKVLWEASTSAAAPTAGNIVNATVNYNKGYIEFNTGGSQGNALIAAYDGDNGTGNILWSWHIWRANTDFADEVYPHGETMMDRNIGTFANNGGVSSIGLYYQYGRKDPFPGRVGTDETLAGQAGTAKTNQAGPVSIETTIKNPTVFYTTTGSNNWSSNAASSVWNGDSKTIYDPCPSGYRVPAKSVFTTDGTTIDSENFSTWTGSGTSTARFTYDSKWFAATGRILNTTGELNSADITSSTFMWLNDAYVLQKSGASTLRFTAPGKAYAVGLRCQKTEEGESTESLAPKAGVVYTDEMRFAYTDRDEIGFYNLYSGSVEWTWTPSDSPALSGYTSYFDYFNEVKPINGGADVLVCASGGGVAMVHVSDKSIRFFAIPMGQPHSMEVLPDGNIVVATSVTYDGYGNMLKVYALPSSGASPKVDACESYVYNYSGHNVVWDSTNSCLWATSDNVINCYSYNSGTHTLSLSVSYELPGGNAHELSKVYGEDDMWLATGSALYKFNPSTHKCTRIDGDYANLKCVSSGPSGFPTLIISPTVDYYTDTIIDLYGDSHYSKSGARFYKARWIL